MKRLDETDRAIIHQLWEDGRRSYTTIGKAVGLSEASVRQRVSRMVRDGVFRITVITNTMQLGYATAGLGFKVHNGSLAEMAERIAAFPEVDFVSVCTGSCDLNVGLVCESHERLFQLLTDELRTIPGLDIVELHLHVDVVKNEFKW